MSSRPGVGRGRAARHVPSRVSPGAAAGGRGRRARRRGRGARARVRAWFLANIAIAPELQRRGLGTAIVGEVVREAASAGAAVTLRVLRVNPARALYERLGFRVTGETATHYVMRCEG